MRLFAIDMDGTCLDGRSRIPPENLAAMRRAAAAGVEIVPATGRALSCLPYQLAGEDYIRYVISSNGAAVTDIMAGRELYRAPIPPGTAEAVLSECMGAGIGITIHAGHGFYILGRGLYLLGRAVYGRDARRAKCVRGLSPVLRGHAGDIEELQLFCFSAASRGAAREILAGHPELCAAWDSHYVEVVSRDAGKGTALRALLGRLGVEKCEAACIGDGENDAGMFRESGLAIAVGNASEALKAAARYVVASNGRGGVAEAIGKYIL